MKRPFTDTDLAAFIAKRVLELRPKSQIDIAGEAGFVNANVLSMLKSGATKLPLDRVLALAKALECDPNAFSYSHSISGATRPRKPRLRTSSALS